MQKLTLTTCVSLDLFGIQSNFETRITYIYTPSDVPVSAPVGLAEDLLVIRMDVRDPTEHAWFTLPWFMAVTATAGIRRELVEHAKSQLELALVA